MENSSYDIHEGLSKIARQLLWMSPKLHEMILWKANFETFLENVQVQTNTLLFHFKVCLISFHTKDRIDQIKVPLIAPMARTHGIILVPVLLWNLIQYWHRQNFRIDHNTMKNMLQPMLVRNHMRFQKNDHRCGSHLNTFHFGPHQTLSFGKCIDHHLGW